MNLMRIEDLLSQHRYFKGMAKEQISYVAGCGSNRVLQPGEMLARTGDEATEFYAIREGDLAIEIFDAARGLITVQTVGEGGIVGWSWIIPPHRWQFHVRSRDVSKVIAFDGVCLRNKCESDHDMGYEFLKRFSTVAVDRLQATRLQLFEIYERKIDESPSDL